jgi:hypothetical protein
VGKQKEDIRLMPPRKPSPAVERRGNPPLKYNQELADTFGIHPSVEAPEPPRELVRVDHIPVPPDADNPPAPPRGKKNEDVVMDASEDRLVLILREEMEELSERLKRFGIRFDASAQQSMVDYGMAVLAGAVGGGAVARR